MDNTFKMNHGKIENQYNYTYYTLVGNHTSVDDDGQPLIDNKEKSMAYIKKSETESQYYIKVGLYGKIFNPIGLYSEGKQNKFLSKVGKNEYNFTRVNKKVFDMYLNFLKSKNIAWLNNAERELS
jgi:uncharacterized protein YigE (DUF2233 family)